MYPVVFILASACVVVASLAPSAAAQPFPGPMPGIAIQDPDGSSIEREPLVQFAQVRNPHCSGIYARQKALRTNCPETRGRSASWGRSGDRRRPRSSADDWRHQGGNFRTVCVRLCDGYYHALSVTSSRNRLQQDAERCAGQYPPGKAKLFYYRFPYGEIDQAVSLKGERYAKQDYAFAFRTKFMPHCAAQLQQGIAALKERVYAAVPMLLDEPVALESLPVSAILVPIARQDRASDPETLDNRRGDFKPRPVMPATETVATRTVGDPNYFNRENKGPPSHIPGYEPPVLKDYRLLMRASIEQRLN